jgi:hypothetical protein
LSAGFVEVSLGQIVLALTVIDVAQKQQCLSPRTWARRKESIAIAPDPQAYRFLGDSIGQAGGSKEHGRLCYQEALRLAPGYGGARVALQELDEAGPAPPTRSTSVSGWAATLRIGEGGGSSSVRRPTRPRRCCLACCSQRLACTSWLRKALREAGVVNQVAFLLARAPAAHVTLDNPYRVATFLGALQRLDAWDEATRLSDSD